MAQTIIRVFFVLACVVMGVLWAIYFVGAENERRFELRERMVGEGMSLADAEVQVPDVSEVRYAALGASFGVVVALGILLGLRLITQELFERLSPAFVAIALGLFVGMGLSRYILFWLETDDPTLQIFLTTTIMLVFVFIGITLGLTRASNWENLVQAVHRRQFNTANPKLVDTSVIIDGRIAEVCDTGFIEGTLIVPRFILHELQNIADSADVLRRVRGRRGLDILKELQQPESLVTVEVVEDDPKDIREVDSKLVHLAQRFGAKILTNDLNLNKVAQIEGVEVLNLNDLANALKPAVLPDEQMQVKIVKEGKEAMQGVGYLDDGTMVVVDGGKHHVGSQVQVLVTSVLQTSAGRMIFSKIQSVVA